MDEKKLDKFFKSMNKKLNIEILVWIIMTCISVGLIVLSIFMTKWIVESDLPEWLKWWLLLGGK